MKIRIRPADEGDREAWNDLVWKSDTSEIYHTYEWGEVLGKTYGIEVERLIAEEGGEIVGILPYIPFHSILLGRKIVSLPFSDIAGFATINDPMKVSRALLHRLIRESSRLGIDFIEVRKLERDEAPLIREGFSKGFEAYIYLLSTEPSYEGLRRGYSKKVRKNIRKAEREGLWVREARDRRDIFIFYEIYLRRMKELGTPPAPFSFWLKLWDTFQPKDMMKLIFAVLEDKEIAGFTSLLFRDKLYFLLNVSLKEYWRFRGLNELLFDWYIQYACSKGYKWIDFGRTRKGTGVFRFKDKGWGAERHPLNKYYYFLRGRKNPMDSLALQSPTYTRLWSALVPRPITPILGRWIRRKMGDV